MKPAIIAISGTPGTGKTEVAKILAKRLDANLITVPLLLRKKQLGYGYDKKRRTKVIDEKDLEKAVKKNISGDKINIVESHLAHLIKSGSVFVLRANPDALEKRLKKRGWPAAKIRENIEAEMLDGTTIEALQKNENVYEIDTSSAGAEKTAGVILKILNNHYGKKYRAGKISWTEKYGKILTRNLSRRNRLAKPKR
ncbi:MAG: adenylate kinase family protein [Candidatus Aenigmarchaeota archaeon]|nr:adenylate kinase family protein [Candidatus Aenigmarchaeota archaeon]